MALSVVVLVISLLSSLVTAQGPPVITPSGSVIVLYGNDLLVKCEASGSILSYQWLDSNGVIITTSNTSPLLLNITNVTQSDSGTYICKVIYTNSITENSSILIIVGDGWSTSASSHIIGALPFKDKRSLSLIITTVENEPVTFTIKNLAGTISSGSVTSNIPKTVTLDLSNTVDSRTDREKGIIVSTGSRSKISVFVAGDGYDVGGGKTAGVYQSYPMWRYPVNEYIYYAISTGSNTVGSFSALLLVSANNDTNITITPTVNIIVPHDLSPTGIDMTITSGNSVTIQLDYLQTLLIDSPNNLTGSKVVSDKPIAVYSGHTCGEAPTPGTFACDFLVEQIPPSASWGNSFLVSPFSTIKSGYLLKFVSSQHNTNINISCQSNITYEIPSLQEDGTASQLITGRNICHIYANNPILVAQFSLGQGYNQVGGFIPSDPGIVIVPPFQHYVTSTVFPAITLLSSTKYMNLAVISSNFNSSQVLLNGVSLGSETWTRINSDDGSSVVGYVLTGYSLSSGINNVSYQDPNGRLCPLIFGSSFFVGYTYTGGLNMIPYGYEVITPSPSIGPPVITPSGSVIVLYGNDLLVKCEASGNILSYQWLDSNGVIITTSNTSPLLLNLTNVTQSDSGTYICKVIYANLATENSSILIIVRDVWSTSASSHIIGVLPFKDKRSLSLIITTVENEPVTFTIKNLAGTISSGSVTSNIPKTVTLDLSNTVDSRTDREKGIIVSTGSRSKISVFVAGDGYDVGGGKTAGVYQSYPMWRYPVNEYIYYAISTGSNTVGSFSALLLVSANNDTNITITPTVNIIIPHDLSPTGIDMTITSGNSVTIQLDYLQTLLIDSPNNLTGSKVVSDKPIAVYSGHTCGEAPTPGTFACDFLIEQIPPSASWGNSFLVSPFSTIKSGYLLKFVSSQHNTNINISCQSNITYEISSLQEDGTASQLITGRNSCHIYANNPILVAQFSLGQGYNQVGGFIPSDPGIVIVPPFQHYVTSTVFPAITLLSSTKYMNLAVISSNFNSSQVLLNGVSLGSETWTRINSDDGSSVVGYVLTGYSLSSDINNVSYQGPNGRLCPLIFGSSFFVGYTYTGGLNMIPYGFEVITPSPSIDVTINPPPLLAVMNGDTAVLNCSASGNPLPTVHWIFHGSNITNDTVKYIITNGVLTILNVELKDAGDYHCTASNVYRSVRGTIELKVQVPPFFINVVSTKTFGILGGNMSLNCTAYGVPRPSVTWRKNNEHISSFSLDITIINDNMTVHQITSYLILSDISHNDSGIYHCNASNDLVEVKSIISSGRVYILSPPSLVKGFVNITKNQSDIVQLSCTFSGQPVPQVTWSRSQNNVDKEELDNRTNKITLTSSINDTTVVSTLKINDVEKTDEGNYICNASNGIPNLIQSQEYNKAFITVQVPPTVQPVSNRVIGLLNESVIISFTITNDFPKVKVYNIQWQFKPLDSETFNSINSELLSENRLSLIISNVQLSNRGLYKLLAQNEAGISEATVVLDVYDVTVNLTPLLAVMNGDTAVLNCSASGNPPPTVRWIFRSNNITNDTVKYIITNGVLTILNVELNDAGVYHCAASNIYRSVRGTIELKVQVPPFFINVLSTNTNGILGGNMSLNCTAYGVPRPSVTWRKNNEHLSSSSSGITIINDSMTAHQVTSYLILSDISHNDSGIYHCNASNELVEVKSIISSGRIYILSPPSLVKGFVNITKNQSDTVQLSCVFSGQPVPQVTWSRSQNNVDKEELDNRTNKITVTSSINDTTVVSTLKINDIEKTDEGNYICNASNGIPNLIQSQEYNKAFITVQVPPTVQPVSNRVIGLLNESVTISFTITDDFPKVKVYNIQWQFKPLDSNTFNSFNSELLSENRLSLIISNVQLSNRGLYKMLAQNEAGISEATVVLDVYDVTVNPTPLLAVMNGDTAVLNCSASGNPPPTVHWIFRGSNITNDTVKYIIANGVLTILNVDLNDAGDYHCTASNVYRSVRGTIELKVQVPPFFINVLSTKTNVILGGNMSFNCTAYGVPRPSVTWRKNNKHISSSSPGITIINDNMTAHQVTSYLILSDISHNDSGIYHCNASNDLVEVKSIISSGRVYILSPPFLEKGFVNITKNQSDTVQLSCTFSGQPVPQVTWSRSQNNADKEELDNRTNKITVTSSSNDTTVVSTLKINNVEKTDEGNYICNASNGIPNLIQSQEYNKAFITVQVPPTVQPVSNRVIGLLNESVIISFTITNDFPKVKVYNIQWQFKPLDSETFNSINSELLSENHLSLIISNVQLSNRGLYKMLAQNEAGISEATVVLDVYDVTVNLTPLLAVMNGDTAVLNCSASGNPPPTVHWIFRGSNITNDTVKYIIANGVLTILNVDLNDAGDYHCTASNVYRSVRGTIELKVQVPPFFINVLSTKTNVILGGNMSFNCTAYGVPRPSVTWRKNNKHISSSSPGITIINDNMTAHQVTSYLILSDISHNDSGIYHCNASNDLVEVKSIISSGRVYILSPPFLEKGFVNITKNQSDTVQLSCTFSGQPVPQVTWSRSQNNADKEELDNRTNKITVTSSSNDTTVVSTLKINNVEKTDEGNYICNASNGIPNLIQSQEYNKAFITVQVPPTVQPVSNRVIGLLNESVIISFTITNDFPKVKVYNIQWQFKPLDSETFNSINSELLSENHLSLIISNVQLSNRGLYKMLAQNEAGISEATVVLDVYDVTINPTPLLAVMNGDTAVLNCSASGNPPPTVHWIFRGSNITNDTVKYIIANGVLTILNVDLNDAGDYHCTASNVYRSVRGTIELKVQVPPFFINVLSTKTNVILGGNMSFNCTAYGVPRPSVTWRKNNKHISSSSPGITIINDNMTAHHVTSYLILSDISHNDSGIYHCNASNDLVEVKSIISSGRVYILSPPSLEKGFVNITKNQSDTVQLSCIFSGQPVPQVTWSRSQNNADKEELDNRTNKITVTSSINDTTVVSTLKINNIEKTDEGNYICNASNGIPNLIQSQEYNKAFITVQVPPTVQPVSNRVIGLLNEFVTISFTITNDFPRVKVYNIQWQFKPLDSNIFNSFNSELLSENRLSLIISNVQLSNRGLYKMLAQNEAGIGEATVVLDVYDVTVNPTPLLAVINGDTAVLNCSASGNPPPTVHWIFRGSNITNDTVKYIITNGVITILNVELNDTGNYHCTASNIYRSVRGTIELKVQVPPFFINVLSTNTNGILGGNMSLNCTAYGVPRPTVTWIKNNEHISSSSSGITIINDSMTAHHVTSYLILSDISHNDSGIYHCNASNDLVEVKSIISSGRVYILSPPSLVKGFVNITKNQSDTVQLSCVFSGQPVPQVTWSRSQNNADKEELDNRTNKITITSSINDTTVVSTLKINDVEKTDEGNYACSASNGIPNLIQSQEYNKAFITVQVPPTVQPVSNRVIGLLNESVIISFTITDDFPKVKIDNIQWQVKSLDSETFILINSTSSDHLSLIISNVQLSNRGLYKMLAENEAGISKATVVLDVYVTAALWNNTGGTVIKINGQNVVFNCTADGLPRPTIVWRRNGQLLLNTSRLKIISSEQNNGFRSNIIPEVLQHTNMLEITNLKGNDNGSYSCRADNEANLGVVLTTPFTLQVIEPPPTNYCLRSPCGKNGKCHSLNNGYLCDCNDGYTGINCEQVVVVSVPPQITKPPKSTSGNLYSTTNLTCKATGSPIPTILWYKDDVLIPNDNNDPSVLLFSELDLNDRGFYHCEARSIIDGKNVFAVSSRVLLNITDVVQYEAKIEIPDDFYEKSNFSISDRISDLIDKSNNYLSGSQLSNTSNTSFFFIQIFNASNFSYTAQVHTIPIVITLVTKSGASEKLKDGVQHQMAMLGRQLSVNISIAEVDRFDGCPPDKTIIPSHSGKQDLELILLWPETNIGGEAVMSCPCGNGSSGGQILQANRYCGGDFIRGAKWSIGNIAACNFSDLAREICQLRNLPVAEKVVRLENLTSNSDVLGSTEVTASVSVLVTATEGVSGNITVRNSFNQHDKVVDNILDVNQDTLQTSQETSNTSAKILEAIESVVENIPLTNTSEPVVISQKSFAVSVQQVDIKEFKESGQTFSVNFGDFSNNNQSLNSNDLTFGGSNQQSTASINLPRNLLNGIPNITNNTRITHSVFITDSLFLRRVDNFQEVGSIILSAAVVGTDTIRGLNPPVGLSFMINPNINGSSPQCSFWNQSLDDGYGDWSSKGCRNITNNETEVICECNHLTSFAILLDVSVTVEPTERTGLTLFLDAVTYIGIIVSLFCLIITIISYLSNKKLRTSDHGQLLLNLCFALMGLYITFIFAVHSRDVPGLCAVTGAVLQYFFLVTFMVMAAEAINLYMNLVIVLGQKISHFVLKATITSWITPFFIVLFCFAPNYKNYLSDHFCRAFNVPYYVGMVVPFLIIYIFNWVVFFIIFVSLIKKSFQSNLKNVKSKDDKSKKSFVRQQLVIVTTLSILFGLGWGIGLLATQDIHTNKTVRDLFAALFVIITAFHGLLIFIMHCLRSKEVRYTWKRCFFGVTGKDISEFSSSFSLKHQRRVQTSSRFTMKSPASPEKASGVFVYDDSTLRRSYGAPGDSGTLRFHTEKEEKRENEQVIAAINLKSIEKGTESVTDPEGSAFPETSFTKSFPDDEEDEKEKLRREEEEEYKLRNQSTTVQES